MASACSLDIEVILATSRLTFGTSSSESCVNSSALACSPNTIRSVAAFRRPDRESISALVVLRIIEPPCRRASHLLFANPRPQDLGGHFRVLLDLLPQVLGHDFRRLGDGWSQL